MMDTYRGGYTKALLDVMDFFEGRSESLSHERLISRKGVSFILEVCQAMLRQKDLLMDYGPNHLEAVRRHDGKIVFK